MQRRVRHLPFVRLVRRSQDASFAQETVAAQEDGYGLCLLLLPWLLRRGSRGRDPLKIASDNGTMLDDALPSQYDVL